MSKRRLFWNSFSGSGLLVVNVAVAFVLSPILIRTLGDRNYGIWIILVSILGYMSILDLGVSPAIVRYVSHAVGAGDRKAVREITSSAFALLVATGLLGAVLMGLAGRFPHLVGVPAGKTELPAVFGVLAVNLLLVFPGMTFSAYQFGLQRHHVANTIKMFQTLGQGIAWYWTLVHTDGPHLVYLAAVLTAGNAFYFGSLTLASLFGAERLRLARADVRRRRMIELYRYGAGSMVLMISDRLQKQAVPIIIGSVLGAAQIVFYSLPNRLVTYATGLAGALTLPITPYFSHLEGSGRSIEETRRAWFLLSRALQFVIVGVGVAMLALGEPFIGRWIGPEYAEGGRWVIRILAATLFLEAMAPVASQFLLGRGRHGAQARITLILAALGIPALLAAAKFLGLVGIAAVYFLIRAGILGAWAHLACRTLELSVRRHLAVTLARYALPAAGTLTVFYFLYRWKIADSYPLILGEGAVAGLVYLLLTLAFAVHGKERAQALRLAAKSLRRKRS